jgi:hypothetical protein
MLSAYLNDLMVHESIDYMHTFSEILFFFAIIFSTAFLYGFKHNAEVSLYM